MTHWHSPPYLVFLAVSLTLLGAAAGASASCPGDNIMRSGEPKATIVTSGTGHSRVIVQNDADGTIRLDQHGKDHAALAVQSGSGGSLAISQSGSSAEASVIQDGECNATRLTQSGSGNRAIVTQSGGSNRVVVRQRSDME
jgi:hypothetical protein